MNFRQPTPGSINRPIYGLKYKIWKARASWVVVIFSIGCALSSVYGERYYVQNGTSAPEESDGDPSHVKADHWKVLCFRKGYPQRIGEQWGGISGSSAAEVMEKLRRSQLIEKGADEVDPKHITIHPTGDCTYFNSLGPIAVIKPSGSSITNAFTKVSEIYERLEELHKVVETVKGLELNESKNVQEPGYQIGSVMKNYMETLQRATSNLSKLQKMLEEPITSVFGAGISSYEADPGPFFNEVNLDIAKCDQLAPLLKPATLSFSGESQMTGADGVHGTSSTHFQLLTDPKAGTFTGTWAGIERWPDKTTDDGTVLISGKMNSLDSLSGETGTLVGGGAGWVHGSFTIKFDADMQAGMFTARFVNGITEEFRIKREVDETAIHKNAAAKRNHAYAAQSRNQPIDTSTSRNTQSLGETAVHRTRAFNAQQAGKDMGKDLGLKDKDPSGGVNARRRAYEEQSRIENTAK